MILPSTFRFLLGRFILIFLVYCFFTFKITANSKYDFSYEFSQLIKEKNYTEALEAVHKRFPVSSDLKFFNLSLVEVHAGNGDAALDYLNQIVFPEKLSEFVFLKSFALFLEASFEETKNYLEEKSGMLNENKKLANVYLKSLLELTDYQKAVLFLDTTQAFDKDQKQFHLWSIIFYHGIEDCKNVAAHAMELYNSQQNPGFYKAGLLSLACAKEWEIVQRYIERESENNLNDTVAFINWLSHNQFQHKNQENKDRAFRSYVNFKQNPQQLLMLVLHFLYQQWLYLLLISLLFIWYFFLVPKKKSKL
ncbi:MAG: hypothetical protein EA412_07190 [Chitinophagaceae bacterium]|nr:MAG: hypothetical protein EA412_07190 [Chitinophagaceae bacterium]